MTNRLVGRPALSDLLRVAQLTRCMSIEIGAQVGFKAVYVSEYWIEWICRDTIEVKESNQLARIPL